LAPPRQVQDHLAARRSPVTIGWNEPQRLSEVGGRSLRLVAAGEEAAAFEPDGAVERPRADSLIKSSLGLGPAFPLHPGAGPSCGVGTEDDGVEHPHGPSRRWAAQLAESLAAASPGGVVEDADR